MPKVTIRTITVSAQYRKSDAGGGWSDSAREVAERRLGDAVSEQANIYGTPTIQSIKIHDVRPEDNRSLFDQIFSSVNCPLHVVTIEAIVSFVKSSE